MENVIVKKLHLVPVLQVVILTVTAFSTYGIAYNRGHVSIYLPFISETGAFSPEMPLFSLGLFFGSIFGSLMTFTFFIINLKTCPQHIKLNIAGLVTGVMSMIGLSGVAAFPMTSVYALHLMFAGTFFIGSCLYFIVVTMITSKKEEGNESNLKRIRMGLTIGIIIFLMFLVLLFPIALIRWDRANTYLIPALKTPKNEGFTLVLIASIFEWGTVIIVLLFSLTFTREFKEYSMNISAIKESSGIDPIERGGTDQEESSSQKQENM